MILKTRLDIAYIILLINRYLVNSVISHLKAIIRIFRYFRNIVYYEFVYKDFLNNLIEYMNFN